MSLGLSIWIVNETLLREKLIIYILTILNVSIYIALLQLWFQIHTLDSIFFPSSASLVQTDVAYLLL